MINQSIKKEKWGRESILLAKNTVFLIQNLYDIAVMLKFFQHLSFLMTHRSWHKVKNECEPTSLIFISPRFRMTITDDGR